MLFCLVSDLLQSLVALIQVLPLMIQFNCMPHQVEGSRATFDIFITVNPVVTIIFDDRTYIR